MFGSLRIALWTQVIFILVHAAPSRNKNRLSTYNIRSKIGWETRVKIADNLHDDLAAYGADTIPMTTIRSAVVFDNYLMSNYSTDLLEKLFTHLHTNELPTSLQFLKYYLQQVTDRNNIWNSARHLYSFLNTHGKKYVYDDSDDDTEETLNSDEMSQINEQLSIIREAEHKLKKKKLFGSKRGLAEPPVKITEKPPTEDFLEPLLSNYDLKRSIIEISSEYGEGSDEDNDNMTDERQSEGYSSLEDDFLCPIAKRSYKHHKHSRKHKSYRKSIKQSTRLTNSINKKILEQLKYIHEKIVEVRELALSNVNTDQVLMLRINHLYNANVSPAQMSKHQKDELDQISNNLMKYTEEIISALPPNERKLTKNLRKKLRTVVDNTVVLLSEQVVLQQQSNKEHTKPTDKHKKHKKNKTEKRIKSGHKIDLSSENEPFGRSYIGDLLKEDSIENFKIKKSEGYKDLQAVLNTGELPTENTMAARPDNSNFIPVVPTDQKNDSFKITEHPQLGKNSKELINKDESINKQVETKPETEKPKEIEATTNGKTVASEENIGQRMAKFPENANQSPKIETAPLNETYVQSFLHKIFGTSDQNGSSTNAAFEGLPEVTKIPPLNQMVPHAGLPTLVTNFQSQTTLPSK